MKTKPIGVRFDPELLEELKNAGKADSPQKALNYLTDLYRVSGIVAFTPPPNSVQEPEKPVKKEKKEETNNMPDNWATMSKGEQFKWMRNNK